MSLMKKNNVIGINLAKRMALNLTLANKLTHGKRSSSSSF